MTTKTTKTTEPERITEVADDAHTLASWFGKGMRPTMDEVERLAALDLVRVVTVVGWSGRQELMLTVKGIDAVALVRSPGLPVRTSINLNTFGEEV